MHTHHRLARLLSVTLLLFPALSFAQAPRIRGPIEDSPSISLEGSLNPHVRTSRNLEDLGPLAPGTSIRGITLVFKRSTQQEADLQQLLAQQTDPSSPLFHHWLTPDDFASRFGLADADIAATETWLQSHGFTINDVSRNRDRITFSGTAAQISQAFATELHRYRDPNTAELHFAPASELALPPALAPVTADVLHLSDFRPKPSVRPQPQYTTLTNQTHFLDPKDLVTLYDVGSFLSNNNGSGQSLAIVGQSYVQTGSNSAIGYFQSSFGEAAGINTIIVPNSGVEAIMPGDVGESEIDLEYSSALAQGANILFVYTGSSSNYDVFDALSYAITQDVAPVVSISYGACEPVLSTADLQQENSLFEEAAAQGQTLIASSGDSGATACAEYASSSGVTTAEQQELAVGFPASSPYVTAVGGTQMAPGTFTAGSSTYWAAATNLDNTDSLLSYVPEVPWNESSSSYGIIASGGGASSIFPRPAWQAGLPGIPTGSYRLVPDIALQASVASPGYLICSDDPYIVGSLTDCSSGSLKASNGTYIITGGTSFGAPVFAALVTNINQQEHTGGLGNINPILYNLAAQPSVYSSAFHDITSGTTACAAGDGNCGTAGESAYAATTGYDEATGLGSIDFTQLLDDWPFTPSTLTPTWVSFSTGGDTYTSTSASAGASVTVTIDVNSTVVTGGFVAPTGTVAVYLDGQLVNASLAITAPTPTNSQSAASVTVTAPSTTGSHILLVRYPGDAVHLPSTSVFSILVGNVVPSGSFTLSAQNTTVANNANGSTQISITPSGGYSGALTWSASASATGGSASQTICYLVEPVSVNGPTNTTMQIGVGTACGSPSASVIPSPIPSPAQRSSVQPSGTPSHRASAAGAFLAFLLCGLFPSRRRRILPIFSICALAVVGLTITGCGGGSSTGCGSNCGITNPQPQVYTLTMTAKDSVNSSITASTSFTLTISN